MSLLPPLPGSPKVAPASSGSPVEGRSFLKPLEHYTSTPVDPTNAQLAQTAWNQGGQTLQIGPLNTHLAIPQWLEHRLIFQGRGLHDVAQGLENAGRWGYDKLTGKPYEAPKPTAQDAIMEAAEKQHPAYNFGVKWPAEFAASLPLGEGAAGITDRLLPAVGEGASLGLRALRASAPAATMGAAYGIQQRQGNPVVNAATGAVTGPVFAGAAHVAGKALGLGAEGLQALYRKFFPRELTQPELDSVLAKRFAERGLPASVTPKPTPPGVSLTTAVHSGNPDLMALQASERISGTGTPFYDVAGSNNGAIVNGLRQGFAPNPDSSTVSSAAHDLLQAAQKRGRAAVTAAYQPFDQIKGGVYLQREPIQNALRDAYGKLLPAYREGLPDKLRQVMEGDHPLHLTTDIEDLSARLNDAYRTAKPGTTASRAAVIMRDALQKGIDEAPLAGESAHAPLVYDPSRAPMPKRNMTTPDAREDSLLKWLAKHPRGLSTEEATAQGLDPADLRSSAARVGLKRAFRNGGMTFDEAAQALHQAGYPVTDESGAYSPNELLNALDSELRGHRVYSISNTRQLAELERDMPAQAPDLTDLADRAMQVDPARTQEILSSWGDDEPATIARVQRELQAVGNSPRTMTLYRGERPGATPGHMNGGALWTTPSRQIAEDYAAHQLGPQGLEGGAGPVNEYRVTLRNPYTLTQDKLPEFSRFYAPGEVEQSGYIDAEGDMGERPGLIGLSPTAAENLRKAGYDSVIAHAEALRPEGEPPSVVLLKSPEELTPQTSAQDASTAWKHAKAANQTFRNRFPQGTQKDSEARQWLSRWLLGRKEPVRFLTEATQTPGRARAVLDAFENPAEREQMRGLLRNHYVNRLLGATRATLPGARTLNADALNQLRSNHAALERAILTPGEIPQLNQWVQVARDNAAILQRLHTGSSETAALRNYGNEKHISAMEELLKHSASRVHPGLGILAHVLPALAKNPDNEGALQRLLTDTLIDPAVYNRVAGTAPPAVSPLAALLHGLSTPANLAATRAPVFLLPRAVSQSK